MEFFSAMIRDLVIVAFVASLCELLLPETQSAGSVRLVFGLYFLCLMLSPVMSFVGDVDLDAIDFEALGEASLMEIDAAYKESLSESLVYDEAAAMLEKDIKGRLDAIYDEENVVVEIEMDESGFRSVVVRGVSENAVVVAEIKDFLGAEYGIDRTVIAVLP